MNPDKLTVQEILFYAFDLRDKSIWVITRFDISESNRLGWLNGYCVFVGDNPNNYIGADIGVDAEFVLTSKHWDISKHFKPQTPTP